ncbi:YadA-like family protein [[Enterobacter] lignolyticus]|uniref:YadA domain-containing protein n=1 Tax=Enterobacter lignolyticus (strain SCF1) TaxID=701347 RepID=E3G7K8_ENTLS|nr:YadA-like family protein [[Enterobacter] lignolyticus]ADO49708.1 YadA domain-containing protein [[Enterobacter] lignolyticus SCF1]
MNTIYRLVWSNRLQATVVAPEFAKGKGGLVSKVVIVAGVALLASQNAFAFTPIGTGATTGTTGNLVIGDNASAANSAPICGNSTDLLGNPYLNGGCADSTVIGNNASNNGYAASVVLGENSRVTGTGSTALGALSTAAQSSLAAGFGAEATGNQTVALGVGTMSTGDGAVAIGYNAFASGGHSIALGYNAGIGEGTNPIPGSTFGNQGSNIAVGDNAGKYVLGTKNLSFGNYSGGNVSGNENITFGASSGSNVYGFDNVSIGPNSGSNINGGVSGGVTQTGSNNTAIGPHAGNNITGGGNIAIGQDAGNGVSANRTVSLGQVANAGGDDSIAIGNSSTVGVGVTGAIAQGANSSVTGNLSVGIGQKANVSGSQSVSVGYNAVVAGSSSGNLGALSIINGNNSYGVGNNNKIDANNASALGNNITIAAGLDNAVALGNGASVAAAVGTSSTTLNGKTYSFAGTSPIATVSIGKAGFERTLTNLAAGRIGSSSTDAVNGSQLFATNSALSALDSGAVKYDLNPDGSVNYSSITLGGPSYDNTTHTGGTKITNVADGTAPSDAVNFSQLTATNNQIANIYSTGTKYFHANSTGTDSSALGLNAVAIGLSAVANNANDVALGANSVTGSTTGTSGVTLAGANYLFAGATPTSQLSVGSAGSERLVTNVAAGRLSATSTDAVNGSQLFATNTALDSLNNNLNSLGAGSVRYDTNTDGSVNYNSITLGGNTYDNSTHTGGTTITNVADGVAPSDAVNFSQLTATNNQIANIYSTGTKYFHANSTGTDSSALGLDAVAIGQNAVANNANDVALGANSVTGTTTGTAGTTLLGTNYTFAGAAPTSQLSVGSAGNERLVTNVAAGSLSGSSTDAVNGSQLYATNTALNSINTTVGSLQQDALLWDSALGAFSAGHGGITVNKITNVAPGTLSSTSTDAVNGSQLYDTNQRIDNLDTRVTNAENANRYVKVNSTGPAADAQGADAVAVGQGTNASGDNSVAIGNGAASTADNAVALGAGSVADRANTVSVGSQGNERQITNVAAGTEDTDAVNLAQLRAATGDISNIENTAKNISNGRDGMFQVNNSSNLSKPTVTGNDAVAGGAGAEASGNNSTALGTRAKATANNSVALGSGSVADRANTVSVGSAGNERQITNVAAGTQGTDAVNLNQLNNGISSANQYTDKRFNDLKNRVDDNNDKLSAGVAGAMAMAALPQPYSAGGSMVGLGGGTYQGQSAVALGVSTISDNGKWVTKLSGTTNSKGDVGAAVGVGYQW